MSATKFCCAPPLRANTSCKLFADAGALYHGLCVAPSLTLNSVVAPSEMLLAKVMTVPGDVPLRKVMPSTGLTPEVPVYGTDDAPTRSSPVPELLHAGTVPNLTAVSPQRLNAPDTTTSKGSFTAPHAVEDV